MKKSFRFLQISLLLGSAITSAHAVSGTWTNTVTGGNWSSSGNWLSGTIADGSGSTANFSTLDITADNTVHLDGPRTLTGLTFGDTTIATAAGWILDNNATPANILTLAGTTPTITVSTLGTGKNATISTVVAGTEGLNKTGAGMLVLSGANTYTGTTTVSEGFLSLMNTTAITSTIASGAELQIGIGSNRSGASTFSGTGTFRVMPGQTLRMSGANNLNLGSGGLIQIDSTAKLWTDFRINIMGANQAAVLLNGTLDVFGSTYWCMDGLSGGGTVSNTLTSSNPVTMELGSANGNGNFSGVIQTGSASTISLTKSGSGTQTLSGSNTYTGVTSVSGGQLILDYTTPASVLGVTPLQMRGGELVFNNLGAKSEVLPSTTVASGASKLIRGTGYTSGVVDLGTLSVTGGTMDVSNLTGSAGWIKAIGNLSSPLLLNGAITTNGGTTLVGTDVGGYLITVATSDWSRGSAATGGGILRLVESGAGLNTLGAPITLAAGASSVTDVNGVFNAYSATAAVPDTAITLDIGATKTLRLAAAGYITSAAGTNLLLSNGILTAGGAVDTDGTITFNATDSIAVGSVITNNGTGIVSVVKNGPGTLALNAANTYTGNTIINGSPLRLAHTNAVQNSVVSIGAVNGLAFDNATSGGSIYTIGGLSGPGNQTLTDIGSNAVTLRVGNNDSTGMIYGGALSGAGSLVKIGSGTQTLSGVNTFTGATNINVGVVTSAAASGAAGTGTFLGGAGTIDTHHVVNIAAGAEVNYGGGANTFLALGGGAPSTGGYGAFYDFNITGSLKINDATSASQILLSTYNLLNGGVISNTGTAHSGSYGILFGWAGANGGNFGSNAGGNITATGTGNQITADRIGFFNGATITTNADSDLTITSIVKDGNTTAGGLIKAGAGSLTLTGTNIYSGSTRVEGGTLTLANNLALQNSIFSGGAGTLVFDSSIVSHAFTIGSLNASTNLKLTDNAANAVALTIGNNTAAANYSGVLSGGASLTKVGTGTQTLSGVTANTYAGLTTLSNGYLALSKSADSVAIPGDIAMNTVNASTLWCTADNQLGGNGTMTFTGATGNARFDLIATRQSLAGIVDATGRGVVQNSEATFPAGVPTSSGIGTLTLTGDGTYAYNGYLRNLTGILELKKTGSGTQTLSGGQIIYTGATQVTGGRLIIKDTGTAYDSASTTIASGKVLEFNASVAGNTQQLNANGMTLTGTGTLEKTGPGQLQFGGNGLTVNVSFGSGALIDIKDGILRNEYSNGNWTANLADLNIGSTATVNLWDANITVDALTGSGIVDKGQNSSHTLTVGVDNGGGIFTGTIKNTTGSVIVRKLGAGTQILSGANTYTGATAVNGGQLILDYSAATTVLSATTPLQMGGGELVFNNLGTKNQALPTTTVVSGASKVTRGAGYTSGVVDLGTMSLTSGSLDVSDLTGSPGWIKATGNLSSPLLLNGAITANGGINLVGTGADGSLITVATADWARSGAATGGGILRLVETGAGPDAAGASITLAGLDGSTTNITGVLNAYTALAASPDTAIIFDIGATKTLRLASAGFITSTVGSNLMLTNGTLSAGGANDTDGVITFYATDTMTIGSAIANNGTGIVSVVKNNPGTLLLNGANSYTGSTTISGGTVVAGSASALGNGSAVTVNNSVLDINGQPLVLSSLAGDALSSVINGGAAVAFTLGNTTTTTFAGSITNAGGSLTKVGIGTQILSGNNTYSGTTISAGTLQIGAGGTTGTLGSGAVAIGGTLAISRSDAYAFANTLSGAGTLSKLGANTVTYNGSSTFSGTVSLAGGAFTVATGASMTGVGTLNSTAVATWNINGTVSATTFSHNNDLNGLNTNVGATGNLTLGTYYGASRAANFVNSASTLTVSAGGVATIGTMWLAANGYDNGNSVTDNVNVSGTLNATTIQGWLLSGSGASVTVNRNLTVNSGGRLNATTINLGVNSDSGNTNNRLLTLNGGTLANLTGTSLTVDATTFVTLTGSGTFEAESGRSITLYGVVQNTGTLEKTGAGTLTLSGISTYSGATTVTAGKLLANNSTALPTNSATGTSTVTVKNNATLGGTGAVTGAVTLESGATLAPGVTGVTDIESLATGELTASAGSSLAMEINSSGTPTCDSVAVTGNLSLGGSLSVTDIAGTPAVISLGTKLTLLTYTGDLNSTFNGLAEGAVLTVGSNNFKVRYADGGNNVTLESISRYDAWTTLNGLSGANSLKTQDADGDGISNLLEYAFGTDPRSSSSGSVSYTGVTVNSHGQPTTSITNIANNVDFRAVFGRRKDAVAAGLIYTVQFSAGLDAWVNSTDTPAVLASDSEIDVVSVPYPLFIPTVNGAKKPTFFRVSVSAP